MTADIVIYHNPDCGTSRNTLAMIRNAGIEPHVVEYLKTPPSRALLEQLIARAGMIPRDLLREKGTPYGELGLDDPALGDAELIDAMMAFPDILLAISLVAALGPSLVNVVIALGIVYTPRLARIVRASTLVIRELPFVEAARALGVPTWRIVTVHVLRNLVSPILVQGTFIFAYAILAEAGLSFLGVGVSPDIPTWGTMINAGQQYMGSADWIMIFPGIAIVLSVLSLQLVGDGLRDVLDPRLRKEL